MKCLRKYKWVKMPREIVIDDKGLMNYYMKLASRVAFRKGTARYCGFENPVEPGLWAGEIVGLKSILGVKKRLLALWISKLNVEMARFQQERSHSSSEV